MCFLVELSVGYSLSAATGQLAECQDSVVAWCKFPLWTTGVTMRIVLQQHWLPLLALVHYYIACRDYEKEHQHFCVSYLGNG